MSAVLLWNELDSKQLTIFELDLSKDRVILIFQHFAAVDDGEKALRLSAKMLDIKRRIVLNFLRLYLRSFQFQSSPKLVLTYERLNARWVYDCCCSCVNYGHYGDG